MTEPNTPVPQVKLDQFVFSVYDEISDPNNTRIDYSILTLSSKGVFEVIHDGLGIQEARDHLSDKLDFAFCFCKHSEKLIFLILYINNNIISEERRSLARSLLEEMRTKLQLFVTSIEEKSMLNSGFIRELSEAASDYIKEEPKSSLRPKRRTIKKKKKDEEKDDPEKKTEENFLVKLEARKSIRRRKEENYSDETGLRRTKSHARRPAKSDASLNRRNSLEEKDREKVGTSESDQVIPIIKATPALSSRVSSTRSFEKSRNKSNTEESLTAKFGHRKESSWDGPSHIRHSKEHSTSSDTSDDGRVFCRAIEHQIAYEEGQLMFMKDDTIEVIDQSGELWEGLCFGVRGFFSPKSVIVIQKGHRYSGSEISDEISIVSFESGTEVENTEYQAIDLIVDWLSLVGLQDYIKMYKEKKIIEDYEVRARLSNLNEEQIKTVLTRTRKLNESITKGTADSIIPLLQDLDISLDNQLDSPSPTLLSPKPKSSGRVETIPIEKLDKASLAMAKKFAILSLTTKLEKKSKNKISTISSNLISTLKKTNPLKDKSADPNQVFGVDLEELIAREYPNGYEGRVVPYFLQQVFSKLREESIHLTEGIFRVPGNARKIQKLREDCNKTGGKVDLSDSKPGDISGVLKLFFKEMPDFLFTSDLYDSYLSVGNIHEDRLKITVIQLLSLLLPPENRFVAQELLEILFKIGSATEKTKLDYKNLAIVIAPSLFGNKRKLAKSNDTRALEKDRLRHEIITEVFEFMIIHHQSIFLVESGVYENLSPNAQPEPIEEKPSKSNKLNIYSTFHALMRVKKRPALHEKSPSS